MDCNTARTWLAFRRPGELPTEEAAALTAHLAACPDCAAGVAKADAFDAAVGKAMVAVSVPAGLADRLKKSTTTKWRIAEARKFGQVAGIAATFLIAFGLIYGVFVTLRPPFNVDDLTMREDATRDDPERAVRDWLASEKLPDDLPLDFNFRNRYFHGKERVAFLGSKRIYSLDVPVILFLVPRQHGGGLDEAKLYLVRDEQFNTREMKDAQSSFFTGKVVRRSNIKPGVWYVVTYSSETLAPFQNPPRPQL